MWCEYEYFSVYLYIHTVYSILKDDVCIFEDHDNIRKRPRSIKKEREHTEREKDVRNAQVKIYTYNK